MAGKGIPRSRWNVGGESSPLGVPDGTKMFPYVRNSNHDPRKRQQISKLYKKGNNQSKVA
jgi:hypothetical protein